MKAAARMTMSLVLLSAACGAARADVQIRALAGERDMRDEETWTFGSLLDFQRQHAFGFGVTLREKGWYVEPLVEAVYSRHEGDEDFRFSFPFFKFNRIAISEEGSLLEFALGASKHWRGTKRLQPYAAAGVTRMRAKQEVSFALFRNAAKLRKDTGLLDDASMGVFLEGGFDWRLGTAFSLGIQARIVRRTNFNDREWVAGLPIYVDGNADYVQLGAVLAWNLPTQ